MAAIRKGRLGEAAELAKVQERASVGALAHIFPPERYPYPRQEVMLRWEAYLEDPAARVLVAEEKGRIVGVACARSGWLDGLYVEPESWSTGIGSALHDRALDALGALGSRQCHLWVLEQNHQARRFYERRGWRQNESTRVVPFPPHPLDVGYTRELE